MLWNQIRLFEISCLRLTFESLFIYSYSSQLVSVCNSEIGRLDLVPPLSLRCHVRDRIEWLSFTVHSRPGSRAAHECRRQAALELSQPVPRRDRWTNGRSPAGRLRVATHDATAGDRKGLDDVSPARGLRAASTRGSAESEDRECRPAVTILRITRNSREFHGVSARDRLSTQREH